MTENCGCTPSLNPQIHYCSLHAAAPDLLEACKQAYNAFPVTANIEDFLVGHGNWGMHSKEFKAVKSLVVAIAKAQGAKNAT